MELQRHWETQLNKHTKELDLLKERKKSTIGLEQEEVQVRIDYHAMEKSQCRRALARIKNM